MAALTCTLIAILWAARQQLSSLLHQTWAKRLWLRIVITGILSVGLSCVAAEAPAEIAQREYPDTGQEAGCTGLGDTLPAEILRQTFMIKVGSAIGTAFTVEVDERQYIVTAQHVLGSASPPMVEMKASKTGWRQVPVTVIGVAERPVDVAVLATDSMLGSRSRVPVGVGTIGYGQEARFLGYPLGLEFTDVPGFREAPLPLIKAGILSGIVRNEAGFFPSIGRCNRQQGFQRRAAYSASTLEERGRLH